MAPRIEMMGVEPMSMICTSVTPASQGTLEKIEFEEQGEHKADDVEWQDATLTASFTKKSE